MKAILATALATTAAAVSPAFAGTSQPSSVVELFTSQGCSSCPRANEFVVDLDRDNPDVLTLSYGVTYWDYLGWKDTFGHTRFTDRQRQYDSVMESGMYTPMMVVGGRHHAPRLRERDAVRSTVPATIALTERAGVFCVEGNLPRGSKLAIIDYVPGSQTVPVRKGENRGRTLELANVVTGIDYAEWQGQAQCGMMPKNALAVLAHDANSSAVIGAARYEPAG